MVFLADEKGTSNGLGAFLLLKKAEQPKGCQDKASQDSLEGQLIIVEQIAAASFVRTISLTYQPCCYSSDTVEVVPQEEAYPCTPCSFCSGNRRGTACRILFLGLKKPLRMR